MLKRRLGMPTLHVRVAMMLLLAGASAHAQDVNARDGEGSTALLRAVWNEFLMVTAVGLGFFIYSLALFRKSIAVTK